MQQEYKIARLIEIINTFIVEGMLRLRNVQREVVKHPIVLRRPVNTMYSCVMSWEKEYICNHK
jgi:hypothetical protein